MLSSALCFHILLWQFLQNVDVVDHVQKNEEKMVSTQIG